MMQNETLFIISMDDREEMRCEPYQVLRSDGRLVFIFSLTPCNCLLIIVFINSLGAGLHL